MRSLGRDHPQRRDEVTRSKIEIEAKLMTAVAELLCIEDEISRGCTTCRENWNPTNLSSGDRNPEPPHPRCHLPTTSGRSLWPAPSLKKMTLPWNDDVVRQDTWQVADRMVSQRVNTHQWMIQDLLPVMHFIWTECRSIINPWIPGTVLNFFLQKLGS